jgi:hypothetical protein
MIKRQKEALRHVVLQVFAYIPVIIQILRYPESSSKANQRYFWIIANEKALMKLEGPRGNIPLGAAVDFNGDVTICERGEETIIRRIVYEDVSMQDFLPHKPTAPFAAEVLCSSIDVKWNKAEGLVDFYEAQYRQVNSNGVAGHWKVLSMQISNCNLVVVDLPCATSFIFRIRAHNPKGWSEWSEASLPIQTLPLPPDRPDVPRVISSGSDYIVLAWTEPLCNGGPITSYAVDCKFEEEEEEGFNNVYLGKDVLTVIQNLVPSTIYSFRVVASNQSGTSPFSKVVSGKTKDASYLQFATSPRHSGTSYHGTAVEEPPLRIVGDWSEIFDSTSNACYYLNSRTAIKQWEKPECMTICLLSSQDAESTFRKKRFNLMRSIRGARSPTSPTASRRFVSIKVRRSPEWILHDSVRALCNMSVEELQMKMKVTFEGEEGMDGGGLSKDWFLEVSKSIFDPRFKLFRISESQRGLYEIDNQLTESEVEATLPYFKFIGRFLGKAVADFQHVDVRFNIFLYMHLLGKGISLETLKDIDNVLHTSLSWMINNDITNIIFETFSVTRLQHGQPTIIDLIAGGNDIEVNNDNKEEYVRLMLKYRTSTCFGKQLQSFLVAFYELVPFEQISTFSTEELQLLLNGRGDINIGELRTMTTYTGGFVASSPCIVWFWAAMSDFTHEQRGAVLRFITGSPKVPLDGFDPPFQIMKDDASPNYLPRSHTCFNQLVLPNYTSQGLMIEKLLYAVNNAVGFQFS